MANPLKQTGGLVILKGNLAPEGCVVQVAGHERMITKGRAVFRSRGRCFQAVQHGKDQDNDVVRHSYEGPRAPGMREMLGVTAALVAPDWAIPSPFLRRAILRATHGLMAGHVAPKRRMADRSRRCATATRLF